MKYENAKFRSCAFLQIVPTLEFRSFAHNSVVHFCLIYCICHTNGRLSGLVLKRAYRGPHALLIQQALGNVLFTLHCTCVSFT